MCIFDMLEHINSRGDGCCAYHIALTGIVHVLQEMGMQECIPDFSPFLGWQCPGCFAMNNSPAKARYRGDSEIGGEMEDDSLLQCDICGDRTFVRSRSDSGRSSSRRTSGDSWGVRDLHQPTPHQPELLLLELEATEAADFAT